MKDINTRNLRRSTNRRLLTGSLRRAFRLHRMLMVCQIQQHMATMLKAPVVTL